MPGDLKIILLAPFREAGDIERLKAKVEELVKMNQEFRIERIEYSEYAKRPADEMMITALLDIAKKLDDLKTQQQMSE